MLGALIGHVPHGGDFNFYQLYIKNLIPRRDNILSILAILVPARAWQYFPPNIKSSDSVPMRSVLWLGTSPACKGIQYSSSKPYTQTGALQSTT
jgi:hypothetical protein